MVGSFGEEREVGKEESARCPFNRFFFLGKSASASSVRKRRKSIFSPRSAASSASSSVSREGESLSLSLVREEEQEERGQIDSSGEKMKSLGVERVEKTKAYAYV